LPVDHRSAIEARRQRFRLRAARRIVPCMFSIALVQASERWRFSIREILRGRGID
jgi:hypothetical protein